MILDSHTHVPAKKEDWPEFLAACRHNGVTGAITSSLAGFTAWPDAQQIRETNQHAREFVAFTGPLVKWLAYLNPHNDNCLEELETCLADGAVGIKLWISIKSKDSSLDRSFPILEAARQKKLPVLIHTLNRTDHLHVGELDMADFAALARRFPEVRLIAAHAGASWRYSLGLLQDISNAYVDISGFLPYKDVVRELVEDLGSERVLFGTDYTGRDISAQLAKVLFADIPDYQKQIILRKNATRLFGFECSDSELSDFTELSRSMIDHDSLPDFRVDHFCFCGNSPFSMNECLPEQLETLLESHNIDKACTAWVESIYVLDMVRANETFKKITTGCKRIEPLATLDPTVANWRIVLQKAVDAFSGGICFPYLHNWQLDDDAYQPFFRECTEKKFPLWINCCFDDFRIRHRGVTPRQVSGEELLNFARQAPDNDYVFQGLDVEQADQVLGRKDRGQGRIKIDISRITDFSHHLGRIVKKHGSADLVFGSEFPTKDIRTVAWVAKKQAQRFES